MKLPSKYLWLAYEGAPRHLVKALELYGTTETLGSQNNPVILGWAKELGLNYTKDEIPWCGLFVSVIMKRANREPVKQPLWAQSWLEFGVPSPTPMLGDVLVFGRKGGGHVGLYVGEDNKSFYVLGGNQSNQVNIVKIAKSRLLQARRPAYISAPTNIRKIILNVSGPTSTNEA